LDTKKSTEILVTKEMLEETRDELKADIASIKLETRSGFEKVDSRFSEVKSEIEGVRSEVAGVRSEISEVKSEIKSLTAAVHRALALHEDQNARNRYVLDGHTNLHDRQERLEKEVRQEISAIKSSIKN